MFLKDYPVIDLIATGDNIKRLRIERGLTVRDLQKYFGFEEPQAIYKWQRGQSLPTVDNLYALGNLFGITMDEILVPVRNQLHIDGEQQGEPCCSHLFFTVFPLLPAYIVSYWVSLLTGFHRCLLSATAAGRVLLLLVLMAGCFRYDRLRIQRQPIFSHRHGLCRTNRRCLCRGE